MLLCLIVDITLVGIAIIVYQNLKSEMQELCDCEKYVVSAFLEVCSTDVANTFQYTLRVRMILHSI